MKNIRTAAFALGVMLVVVLAGTGATSAQIAVSPSAEIAQPGQMLEQTGTNTSVNESNQSEPLAPGARLAGVIGVQHAELESDVAERSFGHALNKTQTNDSKAALLGNETEQIERRLAVMESRMTQLETAYENDTISEGAYQAQIATVSAKINALERQINRTETAGMGLPAHVQSRHNLNETRFAELRAAAGNLSGPEVATIARNIAGPNHGLPVGVRGPPEHAGPNRNMGPDNQVANGSQLNTTTRGPDGQTMGPFSNQTMGPNFNSSIEANDSTDMGPNNGQTTNDSEEDHSRMESPRGNQ